MLKTERTDFLVIDCKNTFLRFQVISGEDQGRRVSIPIYDDAYSQEVHTTLKEIETGDVVEAVLESADHTSPDWRVAELEVKYNAR